MHVSSGCLFDERINSTPYHELMFTPQQSLEALVKISTRRFLGASKRISRPMDLSVKVRGDDGMLYKEFKLLEFLTLCTKNQTAVTSVLDTLNPIESLKQGALD